MELKTLPIVLPEAEISLNNSNMPENDKDWEDCSDDNLDGTSNTDSNSLKEDKDVFRERGRARFKKDKNQENSIKDNSCSRSISIKSSSSHDIRSDSCTSSEYDDYDDIVTENEELKKENRELVKENNKLLKSTIVQSQVLKSRDNEITLLKNELSLFKKKSVDGSKQKSLIPIPISLVKSSSKFKPSSGSTTRLATKN